MRRPPPAAFTLIDTVAGIVVLAVALPALLWALRDAQIQRIDPVRTSTARWLAVEKIEDIIADRHSTTRGYGYLVAGNYPAEASLAGFPGFTRSVALAETRADLTTAGEGYMRVTVSVAWTDGHGAARTLSIASVLTEYDPS